MRDLNIVICYETDQRFMLKFTPIYAVLVHVYAIIRLSKNPRTIGHARFLRRKYFLGPIRTHLRCFGHVLGKKPSEPKPAHDQTHVILRRNFWAPFIFMK
jgi:hypothetical protein